jgi:hypothetical protein
VLALKGMLQLGSTPQVSPDNRHNLAPVDFVSRAIVHISLAARRDHLTTPPRQLLSSLVSTSLAAAAVSALASASASEPSESALSASASASDFKATAEVIAVNVINPLRSPAVAEVIAALVAWAGERGQQRVAVVPYHQWLARLVAVPANAVYPLRRVFEASGDDFPASNVDTFHHANLLRYCVGCPGGVECTATPGRDPVVAQEVTVAGLNATVFPFLAAKGVF